MRVLFVLLLALAVSQPASAEGLRGKATATSFPNSPWWDHWDRLKASLDEHPDIEIEYFLQSELGNEEQQIAALRRGRVQIGAFSCLGLASVVPELAVLLAPNLFRSEAEIDFVYDNYLREPFTELLSEAGMTFAVFNEAGYANLFAKTPVRLPEDAEGIKMRGSPNLSSQVFLENIGADRIALGTADIVPALQTGLIDGGIAGTVLYNFVARQFAPHLTLTRHAYECTAAVMNKRWYERATPEQQAALMDAFTPLERSRPIVRPWIAGMLAEMETEQGVIVHRLTPEEEAAWKAANERAPEAIAAELGGRAEQLLATVRAGQAAFRAQASE